MQQEAGKASLLAVGTGPRSRALDPRALSRARTIRTLVDRRYRHARGRKLGVVETSSTGVVASLTLLADRVRTVPAANGIHFTLCSPGASCPFPSASAAWNVSALRPRRAALELAVRTFTQTTADLVVVALPTRRPVLLVLERPDIRKSLDRAFATAVNGDPSVASTRVRCVVDANTLPYLYAPAGLASISDTEDTFVASRIRLAAPPADTACVDDVNPAT